MHPYEGFVLVAQRRKKGKTMSRASGREWEGIGDTTDRLKNSLSEVNDTRDALPSACIVLWKLLILIMNCRKQL